MQPTLCACECQGCPDASCDQSVFRPHAVQSQPVNLLLQSQQKPSEGNPPGTWSVVASIDEVSCCVCAVQISSKVVSLACKPGRLTVRTVFKFLPGSEGCSRLLLDADTLGSFGRSASPLNRCQLRLTGPAATAANGTDAAAVQAALAAPDNSCQACARCDSCPQEIGVWYSDTASFDYDGCAGLVARPDDVCSHEAWGCGEP
jgi:hypothetical protein